MKYIFSIIFLLVLTTNIVGQKIDDNKILVTISDTFKLYERTRQAIVNSNFIIREDSKRDTLVTVSEKIWNTTIFVVAKIIIKGNVVEISGAYGLGYVDFWGFPIWPKGYTRVTYYKESEAWHLIRQIGLKLDGKLSYYKEK